jgi:ABC-type molybdate transport system permease subunit
VPDRARVRLGGEFGATLATASTEDGAAGTSTHAKTEAVNLGATAVVWLERSLAHNSISMKLIARSEGARRKTTRCSVASTD